MADTVSIILDYLLKNNFKSTAAALRSELVDTTNNPLSTLLDDAETSLHLQKAPTLEFIPITSPAAVTNSLSNNPLLSPKIVQQDFRLVSVESLDADARAASGEPIVLRVDPDVPASVEPQGSYPHHHIPASPPIHTPMPYTTLAAFANGVLAHGGPLLIGDPAASSEPDSPSASFVGQSSRPRPWGLDGDLAKLPPVKLGKSMSGKDLDAGMLNLLDRSFSVPLEAGADQKILPVYPTSGSYGTSEKKTMFPLEIAEEGKTTSGLVTLGPVVVTRPTSGAAAGTNERVGGRRSRPSVSQGIANEVEVTEVFAASTSQPAPLAARVDEVDAVEFNGSGWDSDTYEDEEDVGYLREPIEDEKTFFRTEIHYPSHEDKHLVSPISDPFLAPAKNGQGDGAGDKERGSDASPGADDEVYFSGEEYYQGSTGRHGVEGREGPVGEGEPLDGFGSEGSEGKAEVGGGQEKRRRSHRRSASSVWAGLLRQMSKGNDRDGDAEGEEESLEHHLLNSSIGNHSLGPAASDVAEAGSSFRDSVVGGSSEGEGDGAREAEGTGRGAVKSGGSDVDVEEVGTSPVAGKLPGDVGSRQEEIDSYNQAAEVFRTEGGQEGVGESKQVHEAGSGRRPVHLTIRPGQGGGLGGGGGMGGFSFASPSSGGALSRVDSGRSKWSMGDQPPDKLSLDEGDDGSGVALSRVSSDSLGRGPDDTLASWKRKSRGNSPMGLSPKHPLGDGVEGLAQGGGGEGGDGADEGRGAWFDDAEKQVSRIVAAENTARLDLRAGKGGVGMVGDKDGGGEVVREVDDFFIQGEVVEAGQSDAFFGEVEFDTLQVTTREGKARAPLTLDGSEGLGSFDIVEPKAVRTPVEDEFVLVLPPKEKEMEEEGGGIPVAAAVPDLNRGAQEEGGAMAAEHGGRGGDRDTSSLPQTPTVDDDEYETFHLKVIHRKNRSGFEKEKDFPVLLNSVIAARYLVTDFLGSAAFSKAIQAHDMATGTDVCMKIIKNNKDFFDQSLDEVKLLTYINRQDPDDKHHILRLYDFFYHREHLFIVCELLRANLYEFHKFNRDSGGEIYFNMPRLQSITRQCLEALDFMHSLGLIHCDLKPENILMKSYSRCEIKVIDLGSSCFQTDHLCSYVQSRSYRALEVILGLPYGPKIDIWSLGCILAELCSGQVLFQNDSLATLLARVVGILGPIDPELLRRGRESHKYFTGKGKVYERNPDTDQLEYLIPKKTSLKHRLPIGDPEFVEFIRFLLTVDPDKRPTASEALNHPWMSFPYEPINA